MRRQTALIFLASSLGVAMAATLSIRKHEIQLPQNKIVQISSPDGKWMLIASPFSLNDDRTLTFKDLKTEQQSIIKTYNRDLGVGWSPDSRAFFLNDAWGSNGEDAFIYWPDELTPLQLDDLVLKSDPQARTINADHAYFQVRRWINARAVLVEYCGHTSIYPFQQFDFMYRVQLGERDGHDVTVHQISGHVRPASSLADCAR